jgi:hypothetical protein
MIIAANFATRTLGWGDTIAFGNRRGPSLDTGTFNRGWRASRDSVPRGKNLSLFPQGGGRGTADDVK